MAPRIFIFSIVLGAEYSFYVKSNATYAPTFLGYNNSVLAIVCMQKQYRVSLDNSVLAIVYTEFLHCGPNKLYDDHTCKMTFSGWPSLQ